MRISFILCLLALVAFGCNAEKPSPTQPADNAPAAPSVESPGDDAVTVQIKDYDGLRELLAGKRGKVVVMDCWSTWCSPCVKEFPGLVELHKKYGPQRVACVSLSFDYFGGKDDTPEEHQEAVLEFLRSKNATFDNVLAGVPADDLYGLLGLETASVPAILVYDREGKVARQFEGEDARYSEVDKLVAELIEQP
ncbi:MAG TPA: TlpA disulfide reductase family protein [Pirellulales bacterium]